MKDQWKVVKIISSNGVKVGIDQEVDSSHECVLEDKLTYNDALEKTKEYADKLSLVIFDGNLDVFLEFWTSDK
ncbi:MAG: hypothetical protein ACOCQR_01935 [bacterium]